jgi:hypothetical protein
LSYVDIFFPSDSLPAGASSQQVLVPAFRCLFRCAATVMLLSAAALSQSVSMSAPGSGATVSTPVHVAATANGGSYPISAVWIYVDNQPLYKTTSASVDTNLSLSAGSHHVVPVAWNTKGQVATSSLYITVSTVSSSGGVNISAPSSGTTVSSPVNFVASATASTGRVINTMRIYVDSSNAYTVNAASLNASLTMSTGTHSISMQAWDNTGAVYVKNMNVTVGSSDSNSQYQNNFNATSQYLSKSLKSDGAILYTPQVIDPYFGNIAAIGMTKDPNRMPQVVSWMNWYVSHLNWPDKWGMYGTTYNWNVNSNGTEVSTQAADSTDSYAATFLSVVWNAWKSGNAGARSYIAGLSYQLDVIGGVIIQTQQSDGLTWAKPDYQIKYLMDNCEAYRGLRDLASTYQYAFGDTAKAAYYNKAADSMLNGILSMWLNGKWAVYKDGIGRLAAPNMGTWYADASAQVFPVLMGVVNASDYRAQQSYSALNAAWPNWPSLSFNGQDAFPWCLIGDGAAAMGDKTRLTTYINSIQSKYVNKGFPWPFYNAEAGWFIRGNNYMMGKGL